MDNIINARLERLPARLDRLKPNKHNVTRWHSPDYSTITLDYENGGKSIVSYKDSTNATDIFYKIRSIMEEQVSK